MTTFASDVKAYPKFLARDNEHGHEKVLELPMATAMVLMKSGKLPESFKNKVKAEKLKNPNSKIFLEYEGVKMLADKYLDED